MSTTSLSMASGDSRLESLPAELLRKILIHASLPVTSSHTSTKDINSARDRVPCSLPCLLTSRVLYTATLPVMYRNVTITDCSTLHSMLAQVRQNLQLGSFIRTLEVGTAITSSQTLRTGGQNFLLDLLLLTPHLRQIRIQPSMTMYLDHKTIHTIFCKLQHLQTIEVQNCSFAAAFDTLSIYDDFKASKMTSRLNLDGCRDLRPEVFGFLLPQLAKLEELHISQTQITNEALFSIPSSAKLAALTISHCPQLSGDAIASFIQNHSAARSLKSLCIASGPNSASLSVENVTSILSSDLPALQVLDLRHSGMNSQQMPLLRSLARQLTEMYVGAGLHLEDIESLYLVPKIMSHQPALLSPERCQTFDSKHSVILDPMAKAVAVCSLRKRLNVTTILPNEQQPRLRHLDITSLSMPEQEKLQTSILFGKQAQYLQSFTIGEAVGKNEILETLVKAVGWHITSGSKKCQMVRNYYIQE
ncbi:hypothetical protein BJ878DRAFT_540267 [Calycina marina]|uniref:F-box domain-containing protein n=1 Tax=Calycina marina TaxID=1763456 RepID=A0A9P7Z6Z8_9HELO|nr:hypothetical protein BJ878DRAFT_540267 [Calycina marina]